MRALPMPSDPTAVTFDADIAANAHVEALPPLAATGKIGKLDFHYASRSIVWIEDDRFVRSLTLDLSWTSSPPLPPQSFFSTSSTSSSSSSSSSFVSKRTLFELGSPSGTLRSLAVDWISGQLYYSYTDTSASSLSFIKVTKLPGADYHMTVVALAGGDAATALALNPRLRYLYWMDEGQFAKLERSALDGSNRTVLIAADLGTPTDLVVDVNSGHLYWSDNTRDRIERCDWDGRSRVVLAAANLPNTQALFFVASAPSILFYADARLRSLFSIRLTNTTTTTTPNATRLRRVNQRNGDLQDLVVFSERSQPSNIDSPCSSLTSSTTSQCDQLCFAMPLGSVNTG